MQQLKKLLKRRRAKGQFKGVQDSRIDSKNILKSDRMSGEDDGVKNESHRPKPRIKPKRQPWYRDDLDEKWFDPNTGYLKWPPNDGFSPGTKVSGKIEAGSTIDRFSASNPMNDTGNFFSPANTSYGERALPYNPEMQQYTKYKVLKDIPASTGKTESWFGEIGNGIQYKSDLPVKKLIEDGFLEIIKGG